MAVESRAGSSIGNVGTPTLWIILGINAAWICGTLSGVAFESGTKGQAALAMIATIGGAEATFLLAVRHGASGLLMSAAGFLLFGASAVGEAVLGYTGEGTEAVLGSLAVLHAPAQWLIASQDWSPIWARAGAAVSGLLFLIYGAMYSLGDEPADPDSPLLIGAYLTLIVAIIGWTLTLRAEGDT